jgi:hypothetical protein
MGALKCKAFGKVRSKVTIKCDLVQSPQFGSSPIQQRGWKYVTFTDIDGLAGDFRRYQGSECEAPAVNFWCGGWKLKA